MASLDDELEFVKLLYWGAYGSGKTTDLAYLTKVGPVGWVRVDKGLKAGPLRRLGLDTGRIVPVDDFRPAQLEKQIEAWAGELHDNPGCMAGVCVDTITSLIERRVEVYTDRAWETYKATSRKQHTEIDVGLRYSAADQGDLYQPVTQEIGRLVRHLTDLPCHVGFAAQIRRDVDKKTGHAQYGPGASPAIRGSLVGYCDVVIETEANGYYEDDENAQVFIGYPHPRLDREGKDRYGTLPKILVSPTMDRVIGYVRGELTSKEDPIQARYRETLKARRAREKAEDEL